MRRVLQAATSVVVFAVLMLLSGCALYGHGLHDVDVALLQGRPAEALARLDGLGRGLRNEALYHVNRGMLLRASGDIRGSIAAFEAAKPMLTYQEATSVSETAGRYMLAESASSYQPRPFERLQLHVLQALNHLELGDWDAARVEAVQIDLYLQRLHDGAAPHGGDAFARYLSGIIYEGLGEESNALVAYRKAMQAYDRVSLAMPGDLQRRLLIYTHRLGLDEEYEALRERFGAKRAVEAERLAASATRNSEIIVVASTGLVPRRYEVSSMHQDFTSGKVYRISLPALHPRHSHVNAFFLSADGERLAQSEPVENLAVAAERALADEMPGLIARAITRNVVKNRMANEAGEENQGLEFLVNIASAVLENADVRSWSTLPERYHLLRAQVPVGTRSIELVFQSGNVPVNTRRIENAGANATRPTVIGVNENVLRGETRQ